jgi:hypothetical protein
MRFFIELVLLFIFPPSYLGGGAKVDKFKLDLVLVLELFLVLELKLSSVKIEVLLLKFSS